MAASGSRVSAILLLVALLGAGCASQSAGEPEMPGPAPAAQIGRSAPGWSYALLIDASSSGSSLEVFRWQPRPGRLPAIESPPGNDASGEPWKTKVRPGLSAYAGAPEEAVRSLRPLIEFAIEKLGNEAAVLERTPVFLRATAGLRMLDEADQEEILAAVRVYLEGTQFAPVSARVITGAEEGVYGWIAVNYLLGHLEHGGAFPTVGALDLGGASTQITFVPLDHPREDAQAVTIGNTTYHLYTKSYLGRGQDVAREAVGSPACFPVNYPAAGVGTGTGDFAACRRAIRRTMGGAFDGYQPDLYGDFLAFSAYAYTASFLDLGTGFSPAEMASAGREFCAADWNQTIARDPDVAEDPFVPRYCFAAAYITTLLVDAFGFPEHTERIDAPLRVQGTDVGWTLGALVYELAGAAD